MLLCLVAIGVGLTPLATASMGVTSSNDAEPTPPDADVLDHTLTQAQLSSTTDTATETANTTTTPTPTITSTPSWTPNTTATATRTPTRTASVTPSTTAITTQTTGPGTASAPQRLTVAGLSAPERLRSTEPYIVVTTVRNSTNETRSKRIEYVFSESTVTNRAVRLVGGAPHGVRFGLTANGQLAGTETVPTGTYVHGVHNASEVGIPRYPRVIPDVDLTAEALQAPTAAPSDRGFVALATILNPAGTTITHDVAYRFAGTTISEKAITVGSGGQRRIAFAVMTKQVEAAGDIFPVVNDRTSCIAGGILANLRYDLFSRCKVAAL